MPFAPRLIAVSVLASLGIAAQAQQDPAASLKSRAEVHNDALWAAHWSTPTNDESRATIVAASSRGRAEVRAETIAAILDGSLPRHEDSYTVTVPATGLTLARAQVVAEAREALRLGLIPVHEGHSRVATARENEQIRQAGLRAIDASGRFASSK